MSAEIDRLNAMAAAFFAGCCAVLCWHDLVKPAPAAKPSIAVVVAPRAPVIHPGRFAVPPPAFNDGQDEGGQGDGSDPDGPIDDAYQI
jgi:hypothetical protein